MSEKTRTRLLRAPRRIRSYLAAKAGGPVLLLAASEEAAERYAGEAAVFTDGAVVHLPSRGVAFGDVFEPAVTRVGRRQRALASFSTARLVVAGPLAFMEKTPLHEPLALSGGVETELDETLERLVGLGYERVDRASRPGEFAVRGGIVDVFPSTRRSPVRVEWWGDEVESVRAVSLATQRVVRELEGVTVYAAREGDLAGLAAAAGEDYPEEARRGARVPGLDRLLLDLDPVSPAGLLPDGFEVWREGPQEGLPEDLEDLVRGMYEEALPEPDVEFSLGEEGEEVSAPRRSAAFADSLREAARRLDALVDGGLAVFVACASGGEARRTVYAFGEINRTMREAERVDASLPPGLYALPGPVEEGFTYPEDGVAVVRRDALLGRRREAQAPSRAGRLVVRGPEGRGPGRPRLAGHRAFRGAGGQGGARGHEGLHAGHLPGRGHALRPVRADGAPPQVHRRRGRAAGQARRLDVGRGHRQGPQEGEGARRRAAPALRAAGGRTRLRLPPDAEWERELEESFPYQETTDQEAAIAAVKADMQRPHPTDRLVCGDVGFGKTEVAVRAAFKATLAGKQTMMLAPTTILVQQHERTFERRLGAFAVRVESLSRFTKPAERRRILKAFADGEVDVLIGTHALLGAEVSPKDLGLIIVDEEQRFGVKHKERLKEFKASVDVITLTATPIPRTMQMGLASLRDISVIETPPAGRRSIQTHVGPYDEDLVRRAIEREVARGGQTFFVHNRVESIDEVAERLRSLVPGATFVTAHGQMPERALEGRDAATSSTARPTCSSRRPSSRAASTWRAPTRSSWTGRTRWAWRSSTSCGAGSGAPASRATPTSSRLWVPRSSPRSAWRPSWTSRS